MTGAAERHVPVPERLRLALRTHREVPTHWVRETWARTLPDYRTLFDQLGDEVNRSDVFAIARVIETEADALNAFVAAMVWGHGTNGYGAWRTARVLNDPEAGKKLLAAARETRQRGGPAGFDVMARDRLKYLGVAFATKYLFFCGADTREAPLVLDAVIQRWMGEYGNVWLRLDWNEQDYRTYLKCLTAWADDLGITTAMVEEAMFRDRVGPGSQFAVDVERDATFLLDELDESLTVLLADRGKAQLDETRAHIDALRHLLK